MKITKCRNFGQESIEKPLTGFLMRFIISLRIVLIAFDATKIRRIKQALYPSFITLHCSSTTYIS
jgi:hypothetical protein